MSPGGRSEEDRDEADIEADRQNADPGDPGHGSSADQHKV
jgi:hypothetical protein